MSTSRRARMLGTFPAHVNNNEIPPPCCCTCSQLWASLEVMLGFTPAPQVSLSDLPPDVSLPTAEAVLFIGKAVRVLKQPMSSAASHQALRAHAEILGFSQALHRLQAAEDFSAAQFDHCIETMRAQVGWHRARVPEPALGGRCGSALGM